ncbi:phosphocarrier protein [Roseiarcus fermentans]|uniref:Phosphocarrier protein n=1 Tax=Roseiarcus fermentans TaxID=1473586 RepID=A0A366FUK4_9HYPH|nr:HPr family phosphocarrier protein [Roseiarcus fermentans]RBP18267.1 phosphocarrier protein [Roseiarcus fermentans]
MSDGFSDDCPPAPDIPGALSRDMKIVNRKGLHARATAKFVQCVDRFEADIKVARCGETVGGDSIMGILTLGAGLGSTITVFASGADAQQALDALADLVANRFGEDE